MELGAYHCPSCGAFAEQREARVFLQYGGVGVKLEQETRLTVRTCAHCQDHAMWWDDLLVFPESNPAPPANADLPEEIRRDYLEAAAIVGRSPRGAAALLRLCIEKMSMHLGGKGKSIDDDIKSLAANGLPVRVQQAMDVLRVIGNNAVHPGQVDLTDDTAMALGLFDLVNVVAETMISEPKRIEDMYQKLPEGAREAIEKRDTAKS